MLPFINKHSGNKATTTLLSQCITPTLIPMVTLRSSRPLGPKVLPDDKIVCFIDLYFQKLINGDISFKLKQIRFLSKKVKFATQTLKKLI